MPLAAARTVINNGEMQVELHAIYLIITLYIIQSESACPPPGSTGEDLGLRVPAHDFVGQLLELPLQRLLDDRDDVSADNVKVLVDCLVHHLSERPVSIEQVVEVQGPAADSHPDRKLLHKDVRFAIYVAWFRVHQDISNTPSWTRRRRWKKTKLLGQSKLNNNTCFVTAQTVTSIWGLLTEVASELARPTDRQQQNPPRDVVVAGHVQLRQEQQDLVRSPVLHDSERAGRVIIINGRSVE